jgi:hypothetical protein
MIAVHRNARHGARHARERGVPRPVRGTGIVPQAEEIKRNSPGLRQA